MKYFNIKSIILGIGIGFIITSVYGSIYFSFTVKKTPMTKEEIISKAKEYGMVEATSVLKTSDDKLSASAAPSETQASSKTPVPTAAATPTPTPTPSAQPTPTLGPEVTVRVDSGDTAVIVAKKLLDSKLIDNQDSFIKLMIESGTASKMIAKEHYLRLGMTAEDIIKTLISR